MSKMNRKSDAKVEEEVDATESAKLDFLETSSSNKSNTVRVALECNATARQLQQGAVVPVNNAEKVFSAINADTSRGILTSATVLSIYSDVPESVTVSLNIFNKSSEQPEIDNQKGWLHVPTQTDMGSRHTAGQGGFRNLLNVMPFEKSRQEVSIYSPEDIASDRYIEQYGNTTSDNMYEGVVAFPEEQYYLVKQGHVVLDVIRQNWEQLGVNPDAEHHFNNKYVQVPQHIFDRVTKDLQEQVLSRMPFTNLSALTAKFQTKPAAVYSSEHMDGSNGSFKVCVEMQLNYQYPSQREEVAEE